MWLALDRYKIKEEKNRNTFQLVCMQIKDTHSFPIAPIPFVRLVCFPYINFDIAIATATAAICAKRLINRPLLNVCKQQLTKTTCWYKYIHNYLSSRLVVVVACGFFCCSTIYGPMNMGLIGRYWKTHATAVLVSVSHRTISSHQSKFFVTFAKKNLWSL